MSVHNYLVLHKNEWNRLQRQPSCNNKITNKDKYIKCLNELSQSKINEWPDTVQGRTRKVEKQKEAKRLKNKETTKLISKIKYESHRDAIKRAKNLIFEDSCYGRQLLSAILESKTCEERDLQIKFQNEIKSRDRIAKNNDPKASSLLTPLMELQETTTAFCKKLNALKIQQTNRAMMEVNRRRKILEKEITKQEMLDEDVLRKVTKEEESKAAEKNEILKKELDDYVLQNKRLKELKKVRTEEDERVRIVWQNYQERVNHKSKKLFKERFYSTINEKKYQKVYEDIKTLKEEKNKEYESFVEKGIQRSMFRSEFEEDTAKNHLLTYNKRKLIDEYNKNMANIRLQKSQEQKQWNCECQRQFFIGTNSHKPKETRADITAPLFLTTNNKLLENLKLHEKESPSNALNAAHVHFAERAAESLRQCKYKNVVKKVIDNYRRQNCLSAESFPIDALQ